MSYQAWEDLLDEGADADAGTPAGAASSGAGAAASRGPAVDPQALLREVPALADLMRQRGELERRMASLLGQAPEATGKEARDRLRVGAPPSSAAERAAVRLAELEDLTRRETARVRAAERQTKDESEARRRQHLLDRGRRRLLAQQRRLEEAERRLIEHRLEQAGQRWSAARPELDAARRGPGHAAADVLDRARAPLREYKGQREQLNAQLREQIAKAKQDPQLQEELREDPTALDDLDDLGDELDEALALPDAWVERLDARAEQWAQRLRTVDTWKDRDRRLGVDDVIDALERLDGLRQRKRERSQAERKDQRADERSDARRRERTASRDDEQRSRRRSAAASDDQPRRRKRASTD